MTANPQPKGADELLAINRDFRNLPDAPSPETLWFFTRMSGVAKFPDDLERGKRLQREHPGTIPAKTECEMAAGLWSRIAAALRTPPSVTDEGIVERVAKRLRELDEAAVPEGILTNNEREEFYRRAARAAVQEVLSVREDGR